MLGAIKERDPNLISLEKDVFSLLNGISEENDRLLGIIPEPKYSNQFDQPLCAPLSVEDAIRELLQIQKDSKMEHGSQSNI